MHRLPWPLPALLAWGLAWALCLALRAAGAPGWTTLVLPTLLGIVLAAWGPTRARRLLMAAGFPLSLFASAVTGGQAAAWPAWWWLLPLALLLLAYPLQAWRDAPLFPTPAGVLQALPQLAPLPAGARILDAGCGTGDGLIELRRAYPDAEFAGIEWSWPWRVVAGLRCPWARVRRADMWAADWAGHELVYVFQRPESMARALQKARCELAPGAWLVSLEFEVPDVSPTASLQKPGERPVWLYRIGQGIKQK